MNGAAVYHFDQKTYDNIFTLDKDVTNFIDEELKKEDVNAFIYAVDDNMLHCYYHHLKNEEEIKFYQIRRKNNFDNFVRATLPSDLNASLYIIIDENKKIDKIVNALEQSKYVNNIDIVHEKVNDEYHFPFELDIGPPLLPLLTGESVCNTFIIQSDSLELDKLTSTNLSLPDNIPLVTDQE